MINLDEIITKIKSKCDNIYIAGDVDDADAEKISKTLSENNTNANLAEISFRRSKISDNGLKLIMDELSLFPKIKSLSFDFCFIQHEGAKCIANFLLANKSIIDFRFQRNSATEECWLELAQYAGIHKNECNSWIEIFAPVLAENATIKKVDLSCGYIDDEASELLAAGLASNKTLEKLDIAYSKISTDNMHKICLSVGSNNSLKKIRAQFCGDPRPHFGGAGEEIYQFHRIASETLADEKCMLFEEFDCFKQLQPGKRRRVVPG